MLLPYIRVESQWWFSHHVGSTHSLGFLDELSFEHWLIGLLLVEAKLMLLEHQVLVQDVVMKVINDP